MSSPSGAASQPPRPSRSVAALRAVGGGALFLAALATGAGAQEARWIRSGQAVAGQITSADPKLTDGSHFHVHWVNAQAGERLTVILRSSQFDAFLHVSTAPQPAQGIPSPGSQTDDDGAGGTDAKVEFTATQAGAYAIHVNTLGANETGAYTLAVFPTGGQEPRVGATQAGTQLPTTSAPQGGGAIRMVTAGQAVTGSLSSSDPVLSDNSHYHVYWYRGTPGQRVTVTLSSEAFDSFLAVGEYAGQPAASVPSFQNEQVDDDGGGGSRGLDSRLEYTVGASGLLGIRVNTVSAGETGAYTLTVQAAGGAAPAGGKNMNVSINSGVQQSTAGQVLWIQSGRAVAGELTSSHPRVTDNSHYQLYWYNASAGERVTVVLRSSAFDSFLSVSGAPRTAEAVITDLGRGVLTDNNGGGGRDSRLDVTFPAAGSYAIRVNTMSAGETGRYTLAVFPQGTAEPRP